MTTRLLAWAAILLASSASAQKFAVIGDYGDGPGSAKVATLVKGQFPEFVVTVGDNCYGGVPIATQVGKHYGAFVSASQFWPSLGNHDYNDSCSGSGAAKYRAYFTLPNNERYYRKRIGSVELFAVNSVGKEPDGNTAGSKQALWLKAQLASSTAPWKIVYFHHSPYSSGSSHGSIVKLRWPFEAWGAHVVMSGHDHHYERLLRDDNGDGKKLPYFISGLGGHSIRSAPRPNPGGSVFKYSGDYGALFVTATDTSLSFTFRNTAGAVIDTYSMTKGAAAQSGAFEFKVCC